MRRTVCLALLAALLIVPTAHAAGATEILRDCTDDGVLQGHYTPTELRNARGKIPAELDEYSDCRDVLSRAIANAEQPDVSSQNSNSGGSIGSGGGTNNGGGGTPGTPAATPTAALPSAGGRAPGDVPVLSTDGDRAALAHAAADGDKALESGASPLSPGSSRLAADIGRNGVPGSLAFVLGLLAVIGLVAVAPFVRRRGFPGPRT